MTALRWHFNSYLGGKSLIRFWSVLAQRDKTNGEQNDVAVFSYAYSTEAFRNSFIGKQLPLSFTNKQKNTNVMGHLSKVSLKENYFGKCIFQKWDSLWQTLWLSSQYGYQFSPIVRFIGIKLFICMYVNVAVFNSEVINNLVTMSVQFKRSISK